MSAETSGDVSHIQDEDVLRKMWQDTEDFGKKKEIRSHMYKLREERLRNFYSSSDPASEIQRTQSTPGLHDKSTKEGNGPTHADSLADHSFLSLKSKEIRDSESPTREMSYRINDKTSGGDQGWNVVTKNETSPDGKTHTTSKIATTSGSEKIDGGIANYAAKCEQKASVYNDGDADNFTKSVAASSRNVIQQDAKGGDDNSNFQSSSTNTSSSSKVVTQHRSTGGDTTDFRALPSNVDDSSTTVVRRTFTTDVPAELKNHPNYIDANTKVTTETRTLPDGSKVTTTRYETKGGKTVSSSSTEHFSTSSQQVASEQKSSTTKSTSSRIETQSNNRMIQDNRNVYDDVDRTRIIKQTDSTHIPRQVPDNFNNTERTVSVQVIRSGNDDVNQNVSETFNKTSSSSVNIQKSQKVIDSKNVDINVESDRRFVQTKDIHDTRDVVKKTQDTGRNVDIRQEFTTTKDNVIKTHKSQDVHGTNQDDVRVIRVIQENEYLPRDKQPDFDRVPKGQQSSTTTVRKEVVTTRGGTVETKSTQDIRGGTQDDVRITRIIQEKEYNPRDTQPDFDRIPKQQSQIPRSTQPDFDRIPPNQQTSTTTVRKETTTRDDTVKTTSAQDIRGTTQDDVRVIRVIQEQGHPPRDTQPDFERIPPGQQTSTTTVRKEVITRGDTSKTNIQDVRSGTQDDVRITRIIQEKEYTPRGTQPEFDRISPNQQMVPRGKQPDFERTPTDQQTSTCTVRKEVTTRGGTTTTKTTQDVRGSTHDDVRVVKITQENEYSPRGKQPDSGRTPIDQQPFDGTPTGGRQEVITTRKEVTTTKTSENIPTTTHDDVHITKLIREKEYLPRDKHPEYRTPGDRTPSVSTPGDRTPAVSTPGDRTPIGRTPGDRTPAMQEIVGHLIPQQGRPDQFTPKDQQPDTHDFYITQTTTRTVTSQLDNKTGDRKVVTDDFINKERTHVKDTREPLPQYETPGRREPNQREPSPKYETPEKRQPIKPGKSELDKKPTPTDDQYQTTYRTDYVSKRISVDVSPTHDAFARSLRAISPDRDKKRGSTRSLKSSTSSLRSSTSPEKYPTDRRQPERTSPDRKPGPGSRGPSPTKRIPDKYTTTETVTKITTTSPRRSPTKQTPNDSVNTDTITKRRKDQTYTTTTKTSPERKPLYPTTNNYDTITRTKHVTTDNTRQSKTKTTDTNETIDSSTLTRRPKDRPRSRSTSPTSIASDIEFVKSSEIITDLDDETVTTTRKTNTSRTDTRRDVIQTQRTTVENDFPDKRPTSLNVTTTTTKKTKKITDRSPTSPLTDFYSPTKKSPVKDKLQDKPLKRRDTYDERCRQILGITDKTTVDNNVTEIRKVTKTKLDEAPRSTPRKPSTDGVPRSPSKSPDKIRSPSKEVQEFPSQIRRSPEKQPLERIPGKTRPTKDAPKIQEFPSQIRRSPEKPVLQTPPEKRRPSKEQPKVQEFPSQIRRSPEKQTSERPPEKTRPPSYVTKIQEFPSQIKRTPGKQPLERPPEKSRPVKEGPSVQEFPSQIRRSPDRQPLEKYPEKVRPTKDRPTVDEYPSQDGRLPRIDKTPGDVDEPLFTKKFISTLCRDEEIDRTDVYKTTQRRSPDRRLPQDYVTPSDTDSDRPHKTVKKDSPGEYPSQRGPKQTSPERRQPSVNKTFIDTERTDTDITITEYGREPRRPSKPDRVSPDRVSPDRKTTVTEKYDTDKRTTTTNIREYTDTERGVPRKPDHTSPGRSPSDTETTRRTEVTEYTEEYETPDADRRRPLKPTRTPLDSDTSRRTKITNVTEYTVGVTSDDKPTRRVPVDRRPGRESPEQIRGITEYTDEYSVTDKRQKTATDRVTKTTTKSTRPVPKTTSRSPTDTETRRRTEVTEYTEEYETPEGDRGRPLKPGRTSPTRTPLDSDTTRRTKITNVTEYTDDYHKHVTPDDKTTRRVPTDRSPDRESPEKIRGVTEYTDEYSVTDKRQKTATDRVTKTTTKSTRPVPKTTSRSPTDTETRRSTEVTEYTEEYETPEGDRGRPLKPDRTSPTRTPVDSDTTRRTKITNVTEYTVDVKSGDKPTTRRVPTDRRPDRESPEKIRGVTEYTDEYSVSDKRQKTATDRVTKTTTKATRPVPKTTKPDDNEEETTDSEMDSTTRRRTDNYIVKETTTTVTNGDVPKRTTSPYKPGTVRPKPGITEYPSQKPKTDKTTTKTSRTTTTTRKDRKDEKITVYDVDDVCIDDYYTSKTTKTLTNGDVPKIKTSPKSIKPGVTEYPSQKSPDRKKPLTDRPGKPSKEVPEKRTPTRPGTTKIVYSPHDKPRSPDRYSPSRQVTDKDRIHTTQTVTRKTFTKNITDTYDTKPKSKTPTKIIPRQPEIQPSGKRHVVTTTIQVIPKTRPEGLRKPLQKTVVAHTTVKTRLTQPKTITERGRPRKPTENGRVTTTEDDSETDYEVVDEITGTRRLTEDTYRTTRKTDAKVTRTTSDQVTTSPHRTPVRGQPKPEISSPSKPTRRTDVDKTTKKTDKKVITTKSIIINNDFDDEKEIVVNLQRSTSSREPTPNRIYPRPVSEDEDIGVARYPDEIREPDEPGTRRKPTRLSDIPIIESEDTRQFTRTSQYDDARTEVTRRVNKVEETDDCLLSVNQKVSKFVDEAGKLTKKPQKPLSPTRKSPRPDIVVDETTETDKTYRTSSDKFTKFVSTAEQLTTGQRVPERPKSPKCKSYPDVEDDEEHFTSVSEKVSHFIETAEKVKSPKKPGLRDGPAPRVTRPDFKEVDEVIRTDDCLLSVSDKVTKFSQKLQSPDYKKPVSLAKIDITPKRESPTRESPRRESPRRELPERESPRREIPGRESPTRESPRRELPGRESPRREVPGRESPRRESPRRDTNFVTECVQIDSEDQTYTRRLSPDRYSPGRRESSPRSYPDDKTPTRPSNRHSITTKTDTQESKYTRKDSLIREQDSTPKSSRKDEEPRSVLSPTGRLRSTESIRRAKELFENIAKEQKVTKQRDILSRPSVFDGRKPKHPDTRTTTNEDVKLTDIGVYNVRTSDTRNRNVTSNIRYISDEDIRTTDTTRKTTTSAYNKDDNLRSTRLIKDKLNRPYSPDRDTEVPGYLRPLDRSPRPHSPYNDRSRSPRQGSESPPRARSPRPHDPSLDEIPHYMWPLDRTIHDHSSDRERSHSRSREPTPDLHGKLHSRGSTPDRNVPGYMKPLDRHIKAKSPNRQSIDELDEIVSKQHHDDKTSKFGVTLRRTDSGRVVSTTTSTTSTSQRRKLSAVEIEKILTTQEIEEIYDIEILEVLLERAVSYEQRRRIRSQIRIVKQLIADNKLTIVTTKKTSKTVSPTRDSPKNRGRSPDKPTQIVRRAGDKSQTEYQTEYIRKVSPSNRPVDNKHYQHTDIVTKRSGVDRKSEYQSSYAYSERRTSSEVKTQVRGSSPETKVIRGKSPEKAPRKSITTVEKITRHSPERRTEKTETKSAFKTELRRTTPVSKTVVEEKPSWVTQRPLKKTTDVVPGRKTTSTTTTTTATRKQISSRTSPSKERKHTDVITSSYGVGPTDENGSPLFGLKALRAQNRTDTTKVQGTVIRSHYYSENGQEPTGEVSITKYSTDPRDLEGDVDEETDGLVSVTTKQKFGTKGTPSYKTVIDKKKITDLDDEECETVTRKSTTTKVSRRGSVKEMSKKFIDNAVETSKNERQSSYPKAGLILRTSSFKDTARSGSSRESSPEKQETVSRTVTVKKTTSSSSSGGRADTFLNNKTRVRGVGDVITRMKNADDDDQAGDSPEDKEARSLLNKFIGSQVILSGMETRTSSSSSPSATTVRRTTTTTSTTTKGGGKPTVITRTFTHPITEEDLDTIWDEQTLKLLLERSTDYEERQLIRGRLREVMAEQEVCADVVAKSKEESSGRVEETVETTKKTFTEGPVTTTQVTTRVTGQQQPAKKPISPFAKFRQLDKQNSLNTPPGTPRTPTGSRPLFKFTDPELSRQASTVKERLLQWCQMKTKEYENIQLDNFSSSWADGLAFCALIHHFLPDAFDYYKLTPKERRHNFTLAFRVADEKADILPLLDVDDMVATRKPDWKCVFTYVQTIYSRFKDED